jgi:hypothetical protein
MQARVVSAASGVRWLVDGWRIFRASPLGWLAVVTAYVVFTNVLAVVPAIGVPAALILVPPLSYGLMVAARAAERGVALDLAMLFSGLRPPVARAQLLLGVAYMACSLAVYAAMVLADTEGALRLLFSGKANPEDFDVTDLLVPLLVAAAAYTPVMMAFWFAPPLAGWQAMGPGKAAFFSFMACTLNWRPFLAYGVASGVVLLIVPFAVLSTVMLASGGALRLTVMGLVFPLLLVMLPVLFASFYASYRDLFGEMGAQTSEGMAGESRDDPDEAPPP